MRPVFGQVQEKNTYLSPKCKGCFGCVRTGFGKKLVDGKKVHFEIYGCADIDRTVKCLEEQKESGQNS